MQKKDVNLEIPKRVKNSVDTKYCLLSSRLKKQQWVREMNQWYDVAIKSISL